MSTAFERFAAAKEQRARSARVDVLITEEDHSRERALLAIGNDWTEAHYGGGFYLFPQPMTMPAVSLVFVQSREGNTVADNPEDLGGGDTDLHLIYEGLSRVAVDAVLAGAATARGDVFFSVWHPELVALRQELGLPRHPAQIVVTRDGNIDLDAGLLFNVPDVPVFLIAGPAAHDRWKRTLESRAWITMLPMDSDNLQPPFHELSLRGVRRISAVGGRATASALIDAGLVQDLCLTTTSKSAGRPGTAYYSGNRALTLDVITRKRSTGVNNQPAIRFEQLAVAVGT